MVAAVCVCRQVYCVCACVCAHLRINKQITQLITHTECSDARKLWHASARMWRILQQEAAAGAATAEGAEGAATGGGNS